MIFFLSKQYYLFDLICKPVVRHISSCLKLINFVAKVKKFEGLSEYSLWLHFDILVNENSRAICAVQPGDRDSRRSSDADPSRAGSIYIRPRNKCIPNI